MGRRAKIAAGFAGLAAAGVLAAPLTLSQGGGTIDVFVGSTPTPATTPDPSTANLWVAPSPGAGCTRSASVVAYNSATDCTLAAAVTASQNGDLVLFKTGSYGAWSPLGVAKTITLKAEPGQTPSMSVDISGGAQTTSGWTIDGFSGMGGFLGADGNDTISNVTIKNSSFVSTLRVEKTGTGTVLLDHNTHSRISSGTDVAAITVWGTGQGVTISNSVIGPTTPGIDGIRPDGGNVQIIGNEFTGFHDTAVAHTDPIQWADVDPNPTGNVVRGNYFHDNGDPDNTGDNQGVSSWIMMADGGSNATIEDNVFAGGTHAWVGSQLTFNSDTNSIFRHNTFEYTSSGCGTSTASWTSECGRVSVDHKPANNAGSGTIFRDNIITAVDPGNGSTFSADHNMSPAVIGAVTGATNITGTPTYVGGTHPTTYAGYCLAPGSPGKGAASDGLDIGIRC